MRKPVTALALGLVLAAGTASAMRPADLPLAGQGGQASTPISSATKGALDVPEQWDCKQIEPDYRKWLEDGNSPESWKYAGKTYFDEQTKRLYTWQDWLKWADNAGCGVANADAGNAANAANGANAAGGANVAGGAGATGGAGVVGGTPLGLQLAIGGGILASSVGAIAASSGGKGPKSPG